MSTNFTPPPMPSYGPSPVPPPPPPRKNRTLLVAVAAAVVAAVVSAAVTAGVTGDDEAGPAPTVTVTETASVGGGDTPAAEEESAEEAPAASEDTDDGVHALDETVTYESDVEVSLSGFERTVSSEYAMPEKTPYARFTVKVRNSGTKTLDTTLLTVNCSYGKDGRSSESVFDSDTGLDGTPQTKLLAGRSINVPWGCELPKGEKLIQIEVAPDFDSETAIFTGPVT
ncbi:MULTISPECIES: hypothetical protein [Streptomyces]|uniref:DUF4352 domain-containing protein n=5 Tax=Streptomyces TaxID=1883 RepID=A0A7U9HE79_STRLI|nr:MULTISPECIES: hypothetical protein [Streptomyces]QSJ07664.1 hypothetical protein SLIVDG2_05705 [Streptomyces lividans]WOY96958.1 hypothetical protein R2E43_05705 [Streptomyces violaceoruber]BDD76071.1 hypothetical protein JCM4020_66910 [Streptomyces coelicolor]AIJ12156.1 hypothetical protein SLIV_05705 [Streptomyces lividans TK24]EFD65501.1 conserved hypothetical protein [Streptomyces lividans TK24]